MEEVRAVGLPIVHVEGSLTIIAIAGTMWTTGVGSSLAFASGEVIGTVCFAVCHIKCPRTFIRITGFFRTARVDSFDALAASGVASTISLSVRSVECASTIGSVTRGDRWAGETRRLAVGNTWTAKTGTIRSTNCLTIDNTTGTIATRRGYAAKDGLSREISIVGK